MNCYGKLHGKLADCRKCKLKRHCRNAEDPPLLALNAPPEELNDRILENRRPPSGNRMRTAERDRRYSRADLLEVIIFMASLDFNSVELVMRKLEHPDLNLSKLAESRGVSRQAIHKMVNKRLEQIPELAAVLTYRKHRNRQQPRATTTTFMEEVCRIRRQTQENRLKRPKLASNCLRRLRSSKPSLLSSPMSILKGAAIWKSGSPPSSSR
ncbi:MAG: hypothetical protein HPZ91_05200 [Lentisphaeria bacterium]|nr:hypothetical protein [Lentisphaeria bacterium]